MLKKKIIASSIGNLTDARYFAGWMVDYIHFDLRKDASTPIELQEIGGIQSWIAGPEYLLSLDQGQEVERSLVQFDAHGLFVEGEHQKAGQDWKEFFRLTQKELEKNPSLYAEEYVILTEVSNEKNLEILVKKHDIILFIDNGTVNISEEMMEASWIEGFVVHGSPEEKVGYKSYDELDDFFEKIEDFE